MINFDVEKKKSWGKSLRMEIEEKRKRMGIK